MNNASRSGSRLPILAPLTLLYKVGPPFDIYSNQNGQPRTRVSRKATHPLTQRWATAKVSRTGPFNSAPTQLAAHLGIALQPHRVPQMTNSATINSRLLYARALFQPDCIRMRCSSSSRPPTRPARDLQASSPGHGGLLLMINARTQEHYSSTYAAQERHALRIL